MECNQRTEVQGKTPTYVRPNIYQEHDTNVVTSFACLLLKFIQICNLQSFLQVAGLQRANWVWMEWVGGGEEMKRKGGGKE